MKFFRKLQQAPRIIVRIAKSAEASLERVNQFHRRFDRLMLEQGRIQARLNAELKSDDIRDFEFRTFSQWGEDGIIQHLVSCIAVPSKTFIEFGVEDFTEANCRFLLMKDDWSGLVIDGSAENVRRIMQSEIYWRHHLVAVNEFITRDNISSIIKDAGFESEVGILSVDIDGVDYFILEELEWMRPAIIISEYNSVFGPERKITVPYDPAFVYGQKHYSHLYFGCSLGALHHLLAPRGYSLVGCNSAGVNAFFVRSDLLPAHIRALSVDEAYVRSKVRGSRHPDGSLSFVGGDDRIAIIRGLSVLNVETGELEML